MTAPECRVSLVLVSHSRSLAEATRALAAQMVGDSVRIECAAGSGDCGEALGTDATAIMAALENVVGEAGAVVLMDLGSAILSAETALELLDPPLSARVRLSSGPFVEGAVAAAVRAAAGGTVDEVAEEARNGLGAKKAQLSEADAGADADADAVADAEADAEAVAEAVADAESITVAVADPHGLHARPAARLALRAADYDAAVTIGNATNGKGPAPVSSPIALASLGARHGHLLRITARGPDAAKAARALVALLNERGERPDAMTAATAEMGLAGKGVPVARGVAVGPVVSWQRATFRPSDHVVKDVPAELDRLRVALDRVSAELRASFGQDDMAAAHEALLRDPALAGRARTLVEERRFNAAFAWQRAVDEAARVIAALDDPYLRGREADVRDVGLAVSRALSGEAPGVLPDGLPAIVLVDDLLPSEAARLDPARVLGVLDRRGGPTSHAAILLRGARIPAVFGAAAKIPDGVVPSRAGLDGETGDIWINPDPEITARLESSRAAARQAREARSVGLSVVSLGGDRRVELWANVAGVADTRAAKEAGALGIGLLRTEMLFLGRNDEPGEDEQCDLLADIFSVFDNAPIVVRTLDAGGDKPMPWLGLSREANPNLGVRGVRLSLERMAMFEVQLRAILRAGRGRDVRIMLPMVTTASEIVRAREALGRAHEALERRGVPHLWPIPLGIMIEVPAAAWIADVLARQADFFSIGTNDLTQYVLAAERGHPRLAAFADAAHPAVLALVQRVARAARDAGRDACVCGEAAGDPELAALFVGLGVPKLSMGAASFGAVHAALSGKPFEWLEEAARNALLAEDAAGARAASLCK